MTEPKINVLLVEDQRLIFEGLSSLLGDYPQIRVAGVATTLADAVDKMLLLKPDVVVVEHRLRDGDAVQAVEQVRRQRPETAVLFLSADTSEESMVHAIEAGARGYLSKAVSMEELVAAIETAATGKFLLETATMARVLGHESARPADRS